MIVLFTLSALAATPTYQEPSEEVQAILDASSPPAVVVSPDRQWMLELERPSLRPVAALAEPEVKVAGIKINPDTNGPAREYAYRGIELRDVAPHRKGEPGGHRPPRGRPSPKCLMEFGEHGLQLHTDASSRD